VLCVKDQGGAKGEIISTLPAVGPRSNFTYNESGSPTSTSTTYHIEGEPVTLWQFTTYDAEGRVTGTSQRITEAGATRTLWGESTEYTSTGQVLRETDRFGRLTEYTYDLRGQTIQTRSQSEDEYGVTQWLVSRTVYDSQGRAVVQTGQFVEGAAVTSGSRTVYDSLGRVVRTEQIEDIMVSLIGLSAAGSETHAERPRTSKPCWPCPAGSSLRPGPSSTPPAARLLRTRSTRTHRGLVMLQNRGTRVTAGQERHRSR